jgi:hypothetical protein
MYRWAALQDRQDGTRTDRVFNNQAKCLGANARVDSVTGASK